MEQTSHLKQTVEKLDRAVTRLQDIQSALRGHSPLSVTADSCPQKAPQLSRFHEFSANNLLEFGGHRRWSMPAPLKHDALSDVVAVSKFAKKTVDMVKVQNKKHFAAKSTITPSSHCSSLGEQASLLGPSNRINLPQPVDMSATCNAGKKQKNSSKENQRSPQKSKFEIIDDGKLDPKRCSRSSKYEDEHAENKSRDEASSLANTRRSDRHAYSVRTTPEDERPKQIRDDASLFYNAESFHKSLRPIRIAREEKDVRPNVIKLRALMQVEDATPDPFGHCDYNGETDRNLQQCKESCVSMRNLMRMEDEDRSYGEDVNSFNSPVASKGFSVQLEEIKPSRRKSWNFSHQGKALDNVVVMFPNPTFDEMTPPEECQKAIAPSTIQRVTTLPSTTVKSKADSSHRKDCFQKKEKIVRLTPCTINIGNAQRLNVQPAPAIATASTVSTSKTAPSTKKQKWLCTKTQATASPTLIRKLPESHEMKEIRKTTQNLVVDQENSHSILNSNDDDQNSLGKTWSFGSSSCTTSGERRSSLNLSGGNPFSFLSKHFHAWKSASKEDR